MRSIRFYTPVSTYRSGHFVAGYEETTMDAEQVVRDARDKAAHYQIQFNGALLDPYRICQLYEVGGGPREQILKKCLRGTKKGDIEMKVVDDIIIAALRWKEMLLEDMSSERGVK